MTVSVLYVRPADARALDFTATGLSEPSVTTVRTANAARDALASSAVDCVIVHQTLDEGTGLDVLAGIHEERPDIPVILCSAEADGNLASEATRYDVAAYHVLGGDESLEARVEAELATGADESIRPLSADGAALTHGTAFSNIADTLNAAVVTLDTDSTVHFANDALVELTGYDHSDIVGDSFTKLMPDRFEAAHEAGIEQYATTRERTIDWDYIELAVTHRDGTEIPVTVSFQDFERDGDLFFTGVIRDIRDQQSQARALQQLHEVSSDPDLTTMEKIRSVLDDHRKRLDLDVAFLSRIEDGTERLVAAVGDHPLVEEGADYPLEDTYCQHTIESDEPIIVTTPAEATALDESVYELMGAACYVGETVTVGEELYGTLCFVADAGTDREFDDADIAFLELLTDWVGYELQQQDQREQLRAERQRVETILDRVDDAFFAVDDDWRFTYFNRRAEEVLGKGAAEVMGESIWEVFEAAVGSTFDEKYHEAMDSQEQVTFEEFYPPLDKWFQVSAYPSDDGLSVYFSDVTDRREYTRSLTEMHAKTQALAADTTPEAVAETVLEAAADVLGCTLGTVRRYDDTGMLRPITTSADAETVIGSRPAYGDTDWGPAAALERGETVVYGDPAARARAHPDGPPADPLEDVSSVMYVPVGEDTVLSLGTMEPGGFDETIQSLAELLASHAALAFERVEREQDLRTYETVLDSLEGMVYALDRDGQLTLVTDPLAEWLGYDREELVGTNPRSVMDETEVERFRDELEKLRSATERSVRLETDLIAADGSRLPAEIEISTAHTTEAFDGTIGVVRDLSELRAARQQLETERDRFSYLYDNIPDAVVDVVFEDGVPVVEATNDAFEDVFGYTNEEMVGNSIYEFLLPEAMSPDENGIYGAVSETEQWSGEIRRETADGLRYFLFRGIPYRDADGTLHGFGIYTDITERRQRSRRLQVLTRVLRHNLRNNLAILLGYAEMLREDIEDDRLQAVAESVCDRIHEISDLSEEVRAVQETLSEQTGSFRRVDAGDYIHSLVAEWADSMPEASLTIDVPAGLTLRADERLDLAVENLVENALEHTGERPLVEISAQASGDTLVLTVADDGPGIPDLEWNVVTGQTEITQLSHGSGLGLWTVKWVADSYGGQIRRVPTDLGGAAVELRLPGIVD